MSRVWGVSTRGSCRGAVPLLLMVSLTVRCTFSLRLCSQLSPQPQGVGSSVRVVEGVCDRSSGVLRYAWEVRSADVYRQIEVRCNAEHHEGSWVIVQPRTLNSNDGNESYSIPPNLLDDDVIITSCEIRGCYELYDLFATGSYWTNTLSVTCEATDLVASSVAVSTAPGNVTPTPTISILTIPTSLQTVLLEVTHTLPLPEPSLSPAAKPRQKEFTMPLQLLFILPLLAGPMIIGIAVYVVYRVTHRQSRDLNGAFFDKKFDPSLEPPLGRLVGEMTTPYSSQDTLCDQTDSTKLDHSLTTDSAEHSSLSLAGEESESHERGSSCSERSAGEPPSTEDTTEHECDNITHIDTQFLSTGSVTLKLKGDENMSTEVEGGTHGEEIGVVERGDVGEGQDVDVFPSHFVFELPPAVSVDLSVDLSSSESTVQSSVHCYHTSSSGYVTDTSSLLSPISLSDDRVPPGNEPRFHGNVFQDMYVHYHTGD